jgi:hypothetical protein
MFKGLLQEKYEMASITKYRRQTSAGGLVWLMAD